MKHVTLILNQDKLLKTPVNFNHIENVLVLFFGSSAECIDECANFYGQEVVMQGKRLFPVYSPQDYMKIMDLTLNDYLIMKSSHSSTIHTLENASFALKVLQCGDNLIASIHAQNEEEAIKRINYLFCKCTASNPELIRIGELRDDVEDSKTGHLVYATLPNNVMPSV